MPVGSDVMLDKPLIDDACGEPIVKALHLFGGAEGKWRARGAAVDTGKLQQPLGAGHDTDGDHPLDQILGNALQVAQAGDVAGGDGGTEVSVEPADHVVGCADSAADAKGGRRTEHLVDAEEKKLFRRAYLQPRQQV